MAKSYSITSKYQVTIPKEVREGISLRAKDKLIFKKEGGRYYIAKSMRIEDLQIMNQRLLKKRGVKPATDEDIKNARHEFYKKDLKW